MSNYDKKNAYLSIYAGAGGNDAEDWVKILARMYTRYLEKNKFKIEKISEVRGKGGIRSITFFVKGDSAYKTLKQETGVHRLVRISPFSPKDTRHTSFALVEVLPEIEEGEVQLEDSDLKMETARASGAGGQYVNRRESKVRITHLPTGITVTCQSERLQGENRKRALKLLSSKLLALKQKDKEKELKKAVGELPLAEWGNQIRSYVFHPYQMVKDHKKNKKSGKLERILDGELEQFNK